MRITSQLLRSRARGPLHSTEFIDLSNLDIVAIERLGQCHKLKTLLLRDNSIGAVDNLTGCSQLWKLDLANNRISSLDGLSRFVALGSLILSNNGLGWKELMKIRHMHILHLSLHGNSKLEKDPYYRIHVIDCLPNVWMLDGRIITTAERLQVEHFFQDSALTDHPVRHKFSKEHFVPSCMKKIEVNGIFGEKTTHLLTTFPIHGAKNIETDHRRLKYLAYNLQRDLMLELQYKKVHPSMSLPDTFIEDLIDARPAERERCNMLLLLLVASLEFSIPSFLMNETLETAKLSLLGYVQCIDLFLLPRQERCQVVSVLLSAVKVDRDEKEDGGLYDRLYLCLYYTVAELNKKQQKDSSSSSMQVKKIVVHPIYKEYKCLLAAEVIQLMCIVPAFFEYIEKDKGVISLLITATGDSTVIDRILDSVERMRRNGSDVRRIYEDIAEMILDFIQQNAKNVLNRQITPRSQSKFVLANGLPNRPHSSPIYSPVYASDYHAIGRTTPDHRRVRPLTGRKIREPSGPKPPLLGDRVLVGPQNVGYIIALPEHDIALIQMDAVPAPNGSVVVHAKNLDVHYSYMDMKHLAWDDRNTYWKPKGSVGDRITIQRAEGEDDDIDPPNPPTTPTLHGSTQSLALSTVDDEEQEANKKEIETPRPMSAVLREKLDLKLNLSDEMLKSSSLVRDNQSQQIHEDVDKLLGRSRRDNGKDRGRGNQDSRNGDDDDAVSIEHIENALYDCLKDAMETVKINGKDSKNTFAEESTRTKSDDETWREKQQKSFASIYGKNVDKPLNDSMDRRKENQNAVDVLDGETDGDFDKSERLSKIDKTRPSSSKAPPGMTERAFDEIMLDEVVEVNSTASQPPSKRKGSLESNEEVELKNLNIHINTDVNISGSLKQQDLENIPRLVSSPTRLKSARSRLSSARSSTTQRSLRTLVSQQTMPIMNVDITRPDSSVMTDYQRERTEAWKKTVVPVTSPTSRVASSVTTSSTVPPPQRPSSPLSTPRTGVPAYQPRPTEKTGAVLSGKICNSWLASGQNLHYMNSKSRPRSGHVPGYLEGLEPRPQSIQANRLRRNRHSKSAGTSRWKTNSANRVHRSMEALVPDYSKQAAIHQNYTMRQLGTPPLGAPKRPPSPLNMTYR
ncbi:uncharacterized protein [Ptychodera flava]|uniref:uncharacterized protein n=1 Tax=Ptychodera flava TaxID=63121 RepID=UPI00396A7103